MEYNPRAKAYYVIFNSLFRHNHKTTHNKHTVEMQSRK